MNVARRIQKTTPACRQKPARRALERECAREARAPDANSSRWCLLGMRGCCVAANVYDEISYRSW
eukprot:2481003-Pyramimonas_sp.AAC.1